MNVLDALTDVCGPRHARLAGPADTVAGVDAGWVVAPADALELSAVLRVAATDGLAVIATGAGTKLDWALPPTRVDVLIETGRLAGVYDHDPDELWATIGAGTPLRAVRAALSRVGQRLPLDVGSPAATLGGVLATNEAGPLRLSGGTPRDVVVAVRAALADGSLVHNASGSIVDTVGGSRHDLSLLLCGSNGTLAILTEATVRLQPLPQTRAFVVRPVRTPGDVHELAVAVRESPIPIAALEADLPAASHATRDGELAVLVEGDTESVREWAESIAQILGDESTVQPTPPDWWGRYPFDIDDVALRVEARPADLYAVVYVLSDAAGETLPVRASQAAGVAHVALPSTMSPDRIAGVIRAARTVLLARGSGRCTMLRAPDRVRAAVDTYGPILAANGTRRAKSELDPTGLLAPGRRAEDPDL